MNSNINSITRGGKQWENESYSRICSLRRCSVITKMRRGIQQQQLSLH